MKQIIQRIGMIVAMLLSFLSVLAYDFEVPAGDNGMQKLQYSILSSVDQTVAVVGGTTGIIPCTVTYNNKTYTVTEIGRFAFSDDNITDFRLPLSLKAIRENAFGFSKASTIAIPDGVEIIESDAFWYSSVESIIIGSGVKNIGAGAFYGCSNLKTLVFRSQEAPVHVSRNYDIGNKTTTMIVPQLQGYEGSEIAKVAAGTMIEPIYFQQHQYVYSGEIPKLDYVKKINSAEPQTDMNLKNKDAGTYEQSFYVGLSQVIPSYRFSDYDGYATYPSRGLDVTYEYTITRKPLQVTIANHQRIYGDSNPNVFTYSIDGFVNGENENELDNPIEPYTHASITSEVGEYPITCDCSARNYEIIVKNGILSINKAPLTVQVDDSERVYGDVNPNFTFKLLNLRNNDIPDLITPFKFETASVLSDVGSYPIKCSEGSFKNYDIAEYHFGTLTITKAPLNLTASNVQRMYYEENPQFGYTLVGLRNNDDASCITTQPTYLCSAVLSSDCGKYEIIPSNAQAKNYEISYQSGKLTITKAPLTLVATDISREYGEFNPALKFTTNGLKGDDTVLSALSEEPIMSTTANVSSNVGEYPVIISGGASKNYSLSYRSGILTVTKAPLTVIAEDAERLYGDNNPTFTSSYLGFKLSDTERTAFSALPQATCSATKTSDAGNYPITVNGGTSRNYEIVAYEDGVLKITKAPLILTAIDNSRLYFEDNPSFDYTLSGLRNSDTQSCLSVKPMFTCTASKTSNVGDYVIEPSGASATNYNIEYRPGTLSVDRRQLEASVGNYTRIYGEENPEFDIVYNGFVNNEDKSVLTAEANVICSAGKLSDVGVYPISVEGGSAINYLITQYNSVN